MDDCRWRVSRYYISGRCWAVGTYSRSVQLTGNRMLGRSVEFIGATAVKGKPRARGERGQGFVGDRIGFESQDLQIRDSGAKGEEVETRERRRNESQGVNNL